ncbi:hypothetical protein [Fulvivirga sediminis]|uniref:Lipoprotein n=1 Tax=Fulvivirga sediminis TaxID=2803949 RepID=A0A937K1W7_9BACT|nr:hypothetical protein [Fulvivirga sediminis]MBL3659004.1 hypothetical protein [Fulvivirga sediminis]
MKNTVISFLMILMLAACVVPNEKRLDKIINAQELRIQLNTYGGFAGYSEQNYHLKKSDYENLLIIDEGTDYQTFIRMDEEKKQLLKQFLEEAYKSNDPDKEMSNSCMTGIDTEYIVRSGLTKLRLVPNEKSDSLFWMMVDERN